VPNDPPVAGTRHHRIDPSRSSSIRVRLSRKPANPYCVVCGLRCESFALHWDHRPSTLREPVQPSAARTTRSAQLPTRRRSSAAKALYGVNCQFCHGADTRGGDSGPSLLRSESCSTISTANGSRGRAGRSNRHAEVHVHGRPDRRRRQLHPHVQGRRLRRVRLKPPSIIVGDAKMVKCFSTRNARRVIRPAGDLRGLATKIADPRLLQQTWLMPGSGAAAAARPQ